LEIFEIKWTSRAKKDLRKVYRFYTELAGEEKAFEIISTLLDRVDILSDPKYVNIGAIDEQFSHLKYQYKKLIEKNVKLTYRLSVSKHVVYINRVFETRQHPSKNM
jgi:plasmid stabilization system protein ParE